jgi:hypothetical protein
MPPSNSVVDAAGPAGSTPQGPPSMPSSNLVVDATGPTGSTPQGGTIDVVFKLGGGRCQTHQQRPPVGLPSMSSSTSARHRRHLQNSVVDAVGPTGSAPQGDRHQRLAATGSHCQYPLSTLPRWPLVDNHYWVCYKQDIS